MNHFCGEFVNNPWRQYLVEWFFSRKDFSTALERDKKR